MAFVAMLFAMLAARTFAHAAGPSKMQQPGTAGRAVPAVTGNSVDKWRKAKIRSVWEKLHYTAAAPSASDIEQIGRPGGSTVVDPTAGSSAYFISGIPTSSPSPAGMLMAGSGGNYWPHCTVVLTRPDTVLTARHCIDTLPDRNDFKVFFPGEGFGEAIEHGVSLFCEEDTSSCNARFDDIAAIRLETPFAFTPHARLVAPGVSFPKPGSWAQGYGDSNLVLSDRGVLKSGPVDIADCRCGHGSFAGSGHLCTPIDYGDDDQPPGYYAVYGGQSGSPLFADAGSAFTLLGIASRLSQVCDAETRHEGRYVNLGLPRFRSWLSARVCETNCSPPGPGRRENLLNVPIGFGKSEGTDRYAIQVPAAVTTLQVTLNHELNGFRPEPGGNLDIEMPGSLVAECARYFGAESCKVRNPPPGHYIIGIKTVSGDPVYQLSAVAISNE